MVLLLGHPGSPIGHAGGGGVATASCLPGPRGDSHCLCFPGSVVEDVVNSGQKMAEEALSLMK